MTRKKENKVWLAVLIGLTLFYFAWLYIWQANPSMRTIGGDGLAVIGTFLPSLWLWGAYKRSGTRNDKRYWGLLFLSTLSHFFAATYWYYIELSLPGAAPLTGVYDFFYVCSGFLKFFAFSYRIVSLGNKSILTKFFFDIAVVMTVSVTFSWHYLIAPILQQGEVPLASLATTLFYPIGDLFLLLCVVTFYFGGEYFYKDRTLHYILLGICTHIVSDSLYFIDTVQDTYYSGIWYDPLFILPIMLIGYTALLEKNPITPAARLKRRNEKAMSLIRVSLPYSLVLFLFSLTITRSNGFDVISIGSGISILLVIIRQFIVIADNHRLVRQYHQKTVQLELSEERYKSLFDHHPDSVFSFDLKGKIESLNPAGIQLMGSSQAAMIGSPITDYIEQEHLADVEKNFLTAKKGFVKSHQFTIKNPEGNSLWIDMTHIPILVKNKLVGIFGIGKNITENKANEEKIRFYAYHDYLTGLANRRQFEAKLEQAIEQADQKQTSFTVLFLDLNKFKQINDQYGHDVGDELLSAIAKRIQDFTEEKDIASRLGGDEFSLLLTEVDKATAHKKIAALMDLLSHPYSINHLELTCIPSIGAAYYPSDGTTLSELLSKADLEMYRVKHGDTSNGH
ncbi:sensor domain-containing diguanylate cyclase [Marinilactibacillus piezotolerans]|uniref:sensor domain-containing diguanylate cyclase n=1 Tax=Marinilactibacillus piezotolerans TaxID=258723 RepID=UPI0009AFF042|nr:sensor domain-containing diguanylate cyclase [Marinilactibacillus piezotolerans]